MNKHLAMVLQLFISLFLLFFGVAFYLIGKDMYGPDAALIWVGGMITIWAIRGLAEFIMYLIKLNDADQKGDE